MGKFIIKRQKDKQFYFNLVAVNGQTILRSEAYTTKKGCLNGINAVKINAPFETNFDRRISSNGKYYFNLKAQNSQVIGTSDLYESIAARENGIYSVQRNAATDEIIDNSVL